ncbi:RHS repeat-associated core domain-containing protein, partial [Streptomyces sp. NEAU-H33]
SSGEPLRFTYDTEGRVTRWTDRNGTWFSYIYDDRGRVIRTEGIDGILSGTLTYDDTARTTTYTDSQGRVSAHRYNTEGLVVEETDPLGHVTRTEWDEYGARPLAVTDPLGHTTRYTYDASGNLTEVVLPDDTVAQATYNALGLPTEVVEPGGAVWRHTYDERGNRLTTVDPLGAETRYAYDDAGRPTAITNALGNTRTTSCNFAGLPIAVTDELGYTTTFLRDVYGRITEVTDPLGHVTRTGWTVEGKPAWRELPDGTREKWTWDGEGNLLTHTDPAGNTTQHTPGPFDVPASRTDPDGAHYEFAYDTELRLTTVTNPTGQSWSYTYDAAGRLTAETDFNGRSITYTHDAAGRLTARTNGANETLLYTRDSLGRVVEQRTGTGDITTYAYSPRGTLSRAVNADAEVVLEFDALGRLLSDSVNGRTMAFSYDALGQRTRRITPTGLASDWTYDPAGRLAGLHSEHGSLSFAYDAAGRETQCRIGDGVTLSQTWDANDRLTTQTLRSPSSARHAEVLLQHRSYAYRPDGYITEIRELTSGTRRFDLDAAGRTTAVRALGWSETYAYDTTGNLTRATGPGRPEADDRTFTGTLLRTAGRTGYEYDRQGRLVRKTRKLLNGQTRTWAYTWNAEDRLTAVVTPDEERWHYTYDPLGRRISKRREATGGRAASATDFSWDETRLAEQTGTDGRATTWAYAPGTHRPLTQTDHWSRTRTPGTSFLAQLAGETNADRTTRFHATLTDLVGTPTELVTADGEVAWQRRTTLWGTEFPTGAADGTAVECPLRFPGQYADAETGLNYNHSRYYDPETARYISPDPLGLEPAPNHHAYVTSPLSTSDPLGLTPCGIASVTGPAGETLPLPKGATGTPVATGKGWAYDIPAGTKDLDPRVTQVRVMDPVTTGKYQYPNGYVVYMNKAGQSVNPLTGQTVSKADPYNHIPIP